MAYRIQDMTICNIHKYAHKPRITKQSMALFFSLIPSQFPGGALRFILHEIP